MFSIRKATTADSKLINYLASQIWENTYGHILTKEQLDYMFEMMYTPENILNQMTEKKHIYYIAFSDNEPCGYISIEQADKDLFYFQKIYLLPSIQGKGAGRYLIEQGVKHIKEIHPAPCKVQLYVNRENKALEFYRRMEFKIIDTRDHHIGNNYYMNDYIMERQL